MFFRGVARNHQAEIYHPPALGKLVLFCHVLPATEVADPIRHKQLGDLALLVDSYFGSCTILYIHISMYTYIVCIYIYIVCGNLMKSIYICIQFFCVCI